MRVLTAVPDSGTKEASAINAGVPVNASGRRGEGWGSVYVLLDCSGSMSGSKLDNIIQGVIDFGGEAIKKQYLVGLIKFATHAEHLCEPTKEISRLAAEMKTIEPSGSSNMAEAIRMAGGRLKDFSGTRVMVVATDGHPDNSEDCLKEGAEAKRNGIEIITIGTGDAVEDFLKQLASGKEHEYEDLPG